METKDCFVEVYGEPLPKGLKLKSFCWSIKQKIIADEKGIWKLGNLRSKKKVKLGYLQYYIDGELVEERLNQLQGIVFRKNWGLNNIQQTPEGLIWQTNTTNYIPPQNQTTINEENIIKYSYNPSHYNP